MYCDNIGILWQWRHYEISILLREVDPFSHAYQSLMPLTSGKFRLE